MAAGMDTKVALIKSTVWGTAVPANVALKGFPLRTLPFDIGVGPNLVDDTMGGGGFAQDIVQGNVDLAGQPTAFWRYGDSLNLAIALAMGTAGAPVQIATSGAYTHTFQLAATLEGLMATLAANKGTTIYEWPSVKVHGFTITQRAGGERGEIAFDMIAYPGKIHTDAADPSSISTLASVTTMTPRRLVQGFHCVLRMNAIDDDALASPTHVFEPGDFVFTYQRPMSGDHVMNGSRAITEPELDNVPTITLQVNFPVYRTAAHDALIAAAKAGTEFKADITVTHPSLNAGSSGTNKYKHTIRIPRLAVGNPTNGANGPGKISFAITLDAMRPEVASAGMTGLLLPFDYQTVTSLATDILA